MDYETILPLTVRLQSLSPDPTVVSQSGAMFAVGEVGEW